MGAAAAACTDSKFHVLAVDDSVIDRKLIERLLKTSSFQVTVVDSPAEALRFLGLDDEKKENACCNRNNVEISLIITDYWMPGMTGFDLLRKIKESSHLKDIPVVVVSSENEPLRIKRCLEEGADDFFLKPVKQSDVNKLRSDLVRREGKHHSKMISSCSINPPFLWGKSQHRSARVLFFLLLEKLGRIRRI